VVAESVLVKQQLLILNRSRHRSPNLRVCDRVIAGLCALLMRPSRLIRSAIVLKPSTLLSLHRALKNRKYRLLLYRFRQWQANLRVLEVREIKTVPYVPLSHPFVERLIGTVRREYLDRILFWTTADLETKLLDFQHYYNGHRTHAGLDGRTPEPSLDAGRSPASFRSYRWQQHVADSIKRRERHESLQWGASGKRIGLSNGSAASD
jgi:hypothetical protein